MARIRSMKPELRTDLTVASWPIPARYAWALLWGYLDDQGRGIDDDRLLVADLFPLDRDITERKLATWKKLWADGGQICRYTVAGTAYLHAVKWHHQRINRPTPSRLPPCPAHGGVDERRSFDSLSDSVSDSPNGSLSASGNPHGGLTEDSLRARKEQGAGSREKEQGAGNPPGDTAADAAPPDATAIVARFIDSAVANGQDRPGRGLTGRIGKQAKQLLATSTRPADLLEAATRLGANGWDDLEREVRRVQASRNGSSAVADRMAVGYGDHDRDTPAHTLTADEWQNEAAR